MLLRVSKFDYDKVLIQIAIVIRLGRIWVISKDHCPSQISEDTKHGETLVNDQKVSYEDLEPSKARGRHP